MTPRHSSEYDTATTIRCERTLVTLLGDLGAWGSRIVLIGGLAPRYIVGSLPEVVSAHVGSADVDLAISFAVDDSAETYSTLQANLRNSGFVQCQPSLQWARDVDGAKVKVEFICDTDKAEPGSIYKPKHGTGAKFAAFNVRGVNLISRDNIAVPVTADRLEGGGISTVELRVAGVLSFTALKTFAFQDRHHNKDAYDLVCTLRNHREGPRGAGETASQSPVRGAATVAEALTALERQFETADHEGPASYANFLADIDNREEQQRLRNEALVTVQQFLATA